MAAAMETNGADTAPQTTSPKADPATTPNQTFTVGTRRSLLARVQADEIVKALKRAWPAHTFAIHAMATTGDNDQKTALHKFAEKSLWTQDLEILLQAGQLDLIVHSLKDMPTQLPHDLDLGCVTARHDARDALVIKKSLEEKFHSLADLPAGSVVGTSSLRRIAQLKRHYPSLRFQDVRGNIGTRLGKLDDPGSEYAAIVIAVAGLDRLGLSDRIRSYLTKSNGNMLHAVGQGALGIEIRKGDERTRKLLDPIADLRTTRAVLAERSVMRTLEGGCSVPIGVETEWVSKKASLNPGVGVGVKPSSEYDHLTGVATEALPSSSASGAEGGGAAAAAAEEQDLTDELIMRGIVVSLDGSEVAEIETRRLVRDAKEADQFGWDAAKMLIDRGADKILEKITLDRGIIEEQGNA